MDVKTERICGVDYPKNVVIVHKFGAGKTGPGVGHFDVKLQTYLRVNKIPYKSEVKENNHLTGPKKKTPWIEYNGITMGDSQMIIEFLNKEFKVDMNSHLTNQEKALAWAIQKWIEEFMYWLNVHTRWVIFNDEMFEEGIPPFPMEEKSSVRQWVSGMTYTAGIGRHSNDEVWEELYYGRQNERCGLCCFWYSITNEMANTIGMRGEETLKRGRYIQCNKVSGQDQRPILAGLRLTNMLNAEQEQLNDTQTYSMCITDLNLVNKMLGLCQAHCIDILKILPLHTSF